MDRFEEKKMMKKRYVMKGINFVFDYVGLLY